MGALYDALAAATTREERQAIKAEAFAALDARTRRFVGNRFTIEVLARPVRRLRAVRIYVRITRNANGRDVTPDDLNPIDIVNPPILVDDPAGDVVITDEDGEHRYREDLEAILIGIVRDLLRQRVDDA